MPSAKTDAYYQRAVADLYAAFRDPTRKSGIPPEDTTALIALPNRDIKVLTFGDIADALIAAGWRPPSR